MSSLPTSLPSFQRELEDIYILRQKNIMTKHDYAAFMEEYTLERYEEKSNADIVRQKMATALQEDETRLDEITKETETLSEEAQVLRFEYIDKHIDKLVPEDLVEERTRLTEIYALKNKLRKEKDSILNGPVIKLNTNADMNNFSDSPDQDADIYDDNCWITTSTSASLHALPTDVIIELCSFLALRDITKLSITKSFSDLFQNSITGVTIWRGLFKNVLRTTFNYGDGNNLFSKPIHAQIKYLRLKFKRCILLLAKEYTSKGMNRYTNITDLGDKSFRQAAKYLAMAHEQGHIMSTYTLGRYYQKMYHEVYVDITNHTNPTITKAKELYELAMKQNHQQACVSLGFLYFKGLGVKQSDIKAKELWVKVLKQKKYTLDLTDAREKAMEFMFNLKKSTIQKKQKLQTQIFGIAGISLLFWTWYMDDMRYSVREFIALCVFFLAVLSFKFVDVNQGDLSLDINWTTYYVVLALAAGLVISSSDRTCPGSTVLCWY
jgi:hypothetical protein